MKRTFFYCLLLFFFACNAGKTFNKAEDAQDAGRQFIRASLDGDYEKARFYLLNDSVNLLLISKWQQGFDKMDPETRQKYREANILPINIRTINDSVTTYTYSNSFRKDTTTVRIVRLNGVWLVDLKEILNDKH
ncbi:MAG TPA: hypothetical protein VK772_07195 [Puia sp.]|nr:hypothetical protein [Puia sp.]